MPYATHTTVDGPFALYEAVHAHVLQSTGGRVDGLLVHLARPTAAGFEVFEVWESRELCESATRDVVGPAFAAVAAQQCVQDAAPQQQVEEFTPGGLVIPGAGVAI